MGFEYILIFAIPILLLIFMSMQARKNNARVSEERANALQSGNQVETIGGFIGTVVTVDERTVVLQDMSGNLTQWTHRAIRGLYVEPPALDLDETDSDLDEDGSPASNDDFVNANEQISADNKEAEK